MSSTHGGNLHELAARLGCKAEEILDCSANINPLGPPEQLWPVSYTHLTLPTTPYV